MRFTKHWGLLLGSVLLLAATAGQAYEVDPKTKQVLIESLQDFDLCIKDLSSSGECLEGLIRYAEKKPRDALQAGKKARLQYRSWAALPLFEIALRKKVDKEVCADEDFHISLTSALSLPPQPLLDKAMQLGFTKCWNEAQAVLVKEAKEDTFSTFRRNTCPLFLVKGLTLEVCEPKAPEPAEPDGPRPQILSLKDIKVQSLKLDQQSAVALRGAEDEQVLLVRASGQDDVFVVKFKNVRGPFNNQVFVVRELSSPAGRDYVALVDNDEWVLVMRRNNWTAGMYMTFLKGGNRDGLKVYRGALVDQAGPGSTAEIVREFGK